MNNYPHPIIAREGWPFLAIAFAAALLASQFLGNWSIPFWIIALFVLQFFRDPARVIPIDPKAVLFLLGTEMDYKVDKLSAQFSVKKAGAEVWDDA